MSVTPGQPLLLFSYGTLRQSNVQLAVFGRQLTGREDALPGYRLEPVRITDADVIATSGADIHMIALPSGNREDRVPGTVFDVALADLEAADQYEVGDYRRALVRLESGLDAFLYVARDEKAP